MTFQNRIKRFSTLNLMPIIASVALVLGAALAVPFIAQAQGNLNDYGIPQVATNAGLPTGQPAPATIIALVANILLGTLGTASVLVIIYAGFMWMTAGGNEERVRTAKQVLSGAVIGLALVLSSYVIAQFIVTNLKNAAKTTNTVSTTPTCASQSGACRGICISDEHPVTASDCTGLADTCCVHTY